MRNLWKTGSIAAAAAAAVSAFGASAQAGTLAADGIIDNSGGNEYTHKWIVKLTYDSDKNAGTPNSLINGYDATLYMAQDAQKNLYVAFVLSTDYVDNTYGLNDGTWAGKYDTSHTYSDLDGSDKWGGISLKLNGQEKFGGNMDYIDGSAPNIKSYGFNGSEGTYNAGTDLANLLAAQSSEGYNYKKFVTDLGYMTSTQFTTDSPDVNPDNSYNVADSKFSAWQFACVYEFEIKASLLGTQDLLGSDANGDFLINGFSFSFANTHASPNKVGEHPKYYYTFDVPTGGGSPVVPLPASVWMGGLTLAGVLGRRHLKRRKAAEL